MCRCVEVHEGRYVRMWVCVSLCLCQAMHFVVSQATELKISIVESGKSIWEEVSCRCDHIKGQRLSCDQSALNSMATKFGRRSH